MMYGATDKGFAKKEYLTILNDMQSLAKDLFGNDIDLSERSPLGMFIQVVAWEISDTWEGIENSHFNNFAVYADGVALDKVVGNFGRLRFTGTKATTQIELIGEVGTVIPKGFRVGTQNGVIFETVIEHVLIGNDLIDVVAINNGLDGNVPENSITEIINPIAGVESVTNPIIAENGTDIEKDDELRARHLEALREPATGDNITQYKQWAKETQSVGAVRALATTPSKGYVTIIITDIDGKVANAELVTLVKDYIDPIKPVNAGLIVESATAKNITITSNVQLAQGYEVETVKLEVEDKINQHFKELALQEQYISYAQIGRLIIESKGVIDYTQLKLNDGIANIALTLKEVPNLLNLELTI